MLSLETAVGRPVECGEGCSLMLEAIGYSNVDLLTTVGVLVTFCVAYALLIFLVLWSGRRRVNSSAEIRASHLSAYAVPVPCEHAGEYRARKASGETGQLRLSCSRYVSSYPICQGTWLIPHADPT